MEMASMEPVAEPTMATMEPVAPAPAGGEYPKKRAELTPRTTIEGETLEFYPGESFTMPKFVQVKNCGWP